MTEKQFWMKADQISESHKSHEEKSVLMVPLLKEAYEQNFKIPILYREGVHGQHHVYMNLDDLHPNTIGNRTLVCYTSKRKADTDIQAILSGAGWGYVPARDLMNNMFNKAIIGSLIFNCYSLDLSVPVQKSQLMAIIPGPYPKPDGFVDVPVSGYPRIRFE